MSYNAKNYTEQGGETTHFGGKVIFEEGCEVSGVPFTPAENQAESTADTVTALKTDFNALLAKLKAAGLMIPDTPEEDDGEDDGEDNGDDNGGETEQ